MTIEESKTAADPWTDQCPVCGATQRLKWTTAPKSAEYNKLLGYVGLVARCSKGQLGIVTHVTELPWGVSAVGINLLDGRPWASRTPTMVTWAEVVEIAEAKALLAEKRKAALANG
jgi:hypothetical protein